MEEQALVQKHRRVRPLVALGTAAVGSVVFFFVPFVGFFLLASGLVLALAGNPTRRPMPLRAPRGRIERVAKKYELRVDVSPRTLFDLGARRTVEVDLVGEAAAWSRSESWRLAVGAWLRAVSDDPSVEHVRVLLGCVRFELVSRSKDDRPLDRIDVGLQAVRALVDNPRVKLIEIVRDDRLAIADRIAAVSCVEPNDLARYVDVRAVPLPLVLPTSRRIGPREIAGEALASLAANPQADRVVRIDAIKLLERWGAVVLLRPLLDRVEPTLVPRVRLALRNLQDPGGQLSIAAHGEDGALAFADAAGPGAVSIDDDEDDAIDAPESDPESRPPPST